MRAAEDNGMRGRRDILTGLAASLAGVPLAAILADPVLARAAARELERVTLHLDSGREVAAFLAVHDQTPAPAVMLFHEWWGRNDQIKTMAREFAREGFVALAVDLMDGKTATRRNDAKRLLGRVSRTETLELSGKWLRWLQERPETTDRSATVGWCFGGGWAFSAATVEPVEATVVYYGRVNHPTGELKRLKGPVMGHFATHDLWINRDMVTLFELGMLKARKRSITHWYRARHAFANPTGARYDAEDAALVWRRTLAFLREELR